MSKRVRFTIDFKNLCTCFEDVDAVKTLVTPENVNSRDADGCGVVWMLCWCGGWEKNGDADLLRYFVELGASLEFDDSKRDPNVPSPLYFAASRNKARLVRLLLDFGTPLHYTYTHPPLDGAIYSNARDAARVLIDMGARTEKYQLRWVTQFVEARIQTRQVAIIILGSQQVKSKVPGRGNGKNVLWLIARCVWGSRGFWPPQ